MFGILQKLTFCQTIRPMTLLRHIFQRKILERYEKNSSNQTFPLTLS